MWYYEYINKLFLWYLFNFIVFNSIIMFIVILIGMNLILFSVIYEFFFMWYS